MTIAEYLNKTYTAPQLRKILSEDFGMVGISKDRKAELVMSLAVLLDAAHEDALTEYWERAEKVFEAEQDAAKAAQEKQHAHEMRQIPSLGFDGRCAVYHRQNGGRVLTRRQGRRLAKKFKRAVSKGHDFTTIVMG